VNGTDFAILAGNFGKAEQTYAAAKRVAGWGFVAAKFGWGPYGLGSVEADAEQVRAAREGLGPDATLLILLRDPNADVRAKAAEFAGQRSSVAAIPSLRRLIDDENRDVRQSAIEALSNIGDEAAVAALRAGLSSKDAKVRRSAAEALGDRRQ